MCFWIYACVHTIRVYARVCVHSFISTPSQRQFDDDSEEFIGISRKTKTLIIMEYKRRSDTSPDYKQRGEKAANNQYEKVRKALEEKGANTEWTIKQVNLVMGTRSIEVGSWNVNMTVFGIDKAQADKMRGKHMKRMLTEHDFVLQSYRSHRLQGGQSAPERKYRKRQLDDTVIVSTKR